MSENAAKAAAFIRMAARGQVTVFVDSSTYGVHVPPEHMFNPQLVLNLARPRGAGDWVADDWGLQETLSFNGVRSLVKVPWAAVLACVSHEPLEAKRPPTLTLVKGGR